MYSDVAKILMGTSCARVDKTAYESLADFLYTDCSIGYSAGSNLPCAFLFRGTLLPGTLRRDSSIVTSTARLVIERSLFARMIPPCLLYFVLLFKLMYGCAGFCF